MAVIINTNFWQEDEWKDLSKIVFTSPNIDSPANAGTRSHILPGQGDLGLWYEDSTNMYRIEPEQLTTQSDFYNYTMDVSTTTDLSTAPEYIQVENVSSPVFVTDVLRQVGVEAVGYQEETSNIMDSSVKIEYVPLDTGLDNIFDGPDYVTISDEKSDWSSCMIGGDLYWGYRSRVVEKRQRGWYTEVIPEIPECYITFTFSAPVQIHIISMAAIKFHTYTYFQEFCPYTPYPTSSDLDSIVSTIYYIGTYKIQQSTDGVTWADIYSGTGASTLANNLYINGADYSIYYRIVIQNNTPFVGVSTIDENYYGIGQLKFYGYLYPENTSDDNNVFIYKFNELQSPEILTVKNVSFVDGTEIVTTTTGIHTVAGTINVTTLSGNPYYSEYYVNTQTSSGDYITSALCTATVVSGVGIDVIDGGYESSTRAAIDDNIPADISAIVSYPTTSGIIFTSSGTITISCSTTSHVCSKDISYITTTSGVVIPGQNSHGVVGTTKRVITTTSQSKSIGCKLWLSDENTCSGTLTEGDTLSYWGHVPSADYLDVDIYNSVLFEVTFGEAYDCRLTAWDDVTHSTTTNELIANDHVRVSSLAYKAVGSKLAPENADNYIFPPSHNRIFKGDLSDGGYDYFYGDFDMVYRYESEVYGDYLIFKPMLYGITDSLTYGVHDFVITLCYSYT